MPQIANAQPLYFNTFPSGYYSNRSPLSPMDDRGPDAVLSGLNMEHTNSYTWKKRRGAVKYCTEELNAATLVPKTLYGYIQNDGTIINVGDFTNTIRTFTGSATAAVFTKDAAADQCGIVSVGNHYFVSQESAGQAATSVEDYHIKRSYTTSAVNSGVVRWGIPTPAAAPTHTLANDASGITARVGYRYVLCYKDSLDNHIGSASNKSASTKLFGPTKKKVQLSFAAVPDTGAGLCNQRVDKIEIYRTMDGGAIYFYLDEVAASATSYNDTKSDNQLNTDKVAPRGGINNPPPTGMSQVVYHNGRIWGIVDNKVYFSRGPDCLNGDGSEAWYALDFFSFRSPVTAICSTSRGLVVFTSSDMFVITGYSREEFQRIPLRTRIGVLHWNAVTNDGDVIYVYASNKKLYRFTDYVEDVGQPISDADLANFAPNTTYICVHREGAEATLMLSCGSSSNQMLVMNLNTETWCAPWTLGGSVSAGALASIQTGATTFRLLMGGRPGASSSYIWHWNSPTTAQDDGTSIAANLVFGSFVLAPPGELASLESLFFETSATGTATVSFLPQEISGSFTTIATAVDDPAELSASSTIYSKRYYPQQTSKPCIMRHLQYKIAWSAENSQPELYSLALRIAQWPK